MAMAMEQHLYMKGRRGVERGVAASPACLTGCLAACSLLGGTLSRLWWLYAPSTLTWQLGNRVRAQCAENNHPVRSLNPEVDPYACAPRRAPLETRRTAWFRG